MHIDLTISDEEDSQQPSNAQHSSIDLTGDEFERPLKTMKTSPSSAPHTYLPKNTASSALNPSIVDPKLIYLKTKNGEINNLVPKTILVVKTCAQVCFFNLGPF